LLWIGQNKVGKKMVMSRELLELFMSIRLLLQIMSKEESSFHEVQKEFAKELTTRLEEYLKTVTEISD
jgi:hypothetical protein